MQVSGNVSQVEAQLAGLQQALLHNKDLLHRKLHEESSARQQSEQAAEVGEVLGKGKPARQKAPCLSCRPRTDTFD